MILLDTNVLSALMQRQPEPGRRGVAGLPTTGVYLDNVRHFEGLGPALIDPWSR